MALVNHTNAEPCKSINESAQIWFEETSTIGADRKRLIQGILYCRQLAEINDVNVKNVRACNGEAHATVDFPVQRVSRRKYLRLYSTVRQIALCISLAELWLDYIHCPKLSETLPLFVGDRFDRFALLRYRTASAKREVSCCTGPSHLTQYSRIVFPFPSEGCPYTLDT